MRIPHEHHWPAGRGNHNRNNHMELCVRHGGTYVHVVPGYVVDYNERP